MKVTVVETGGPELTDERVFVGVFRAERYWWSSPDLSLSEERLLIQFMNGGKEYTTHVKLCPKTKFTIESEEE